MAETEARLRAHLPDVLVNLVLGYFRSEDRWSWGIARAGEFEECMAIGCRDGTLDGACASEHIELINYLLSVCELDDDANDPDSSAKNAICDGFNSSTRALLEADVVSPDDCLDWACTYGNIEAAQLAIEFGAANWTRAADSACYCGHDAIYTLMLAKGAKPCACGRHDARNVD